MKKHLLPLLFISLQCSIAQSPMPGYKLAEQRLPACFDELLKCNCINQIYQDRKGFLWLATPLGLIRFDGYDFKYFRNDPANNKTIANNSVLKLVEDKNGNIWAGLNEKGISCYDPVLNEFTNYNILLDSSSQNAIVSILVDDDNEVWLSPGYSGLCHLNKRSKTFETYPIITHQNSPYLSAAAAKLSNYAMDIKPRDKNSFWLATTEGLFIFDKTRGISIPVRSKPVDTSKPADYNARKILIDGDVLWIGGWASGIQSYNTKTGKWEQYLFSKRNKSIYTDNIVFDMAEKSADEIWIASSDRGLGIFNKKTKQTVFFSDDKNYSHLPKTFANLVFNDRQQNAWVCFKDAFYKFKSEADQVIAYKIGSYQNQNSGLSITNSVFEDSTGRYVLAGTSFSDGIIFTDKKLNKTNTISVKAALGGGSTMHVNGFIQKDSASVWVLTGDLLLILNLTTQQLSQPVQPMIKGYDWGLNNYSSFVKDDNDNLWIGTPLHGIIYYNIQTGTTEIYSDDNKNSNNVIATNATNCIECDKNNRVWYGSVRSSCLSYFDTKARKTIVLNGSGNPCGKAHSVKTYDLLNVDGDIYASTEGGLLEFDCSGNTPVLKNKINSANGTGADWVRGAAPDSKGNLWLLTALGVCMYNPLTKSLTTIGKGNGLYTEAISISYTLKKNIYLNGINYYYKILEDTKPVISNPIAPVITGLKVNEDEVNAASMLSKYDEVKIKANYAYFSFLYASPDMVNAEEINYSYMLEGYDKNWINAGNRRFANYTNLPGGDYVFKVRSSFGKENKYSSVTEVPMFIGTLFYKAFWFRALIIITILSALYAIYRYRINKQLEINRLNNHTQFLEKEKALVQYEILKQQLNPHFLFNSLAALSGLISTEPGLARTFLEKMTRIYRYILKSSNNELVRLSDEINFASTYINLQETRFQDGLKVNIDINEDYESYKIVPVTIQNMIENAIKHNIISTKTPLTITITVEDAYLVIKNNLQKKPKVETSNKLGLTQLKILYQYLSDKPIIIDETGKDFTIKIPLV